MKLDLLAKKLRSAGILLIVMSIVRSITLMQVFNTWAEESTCFWKEDWAAGKAAWTREVMNAICFSKVTSEIVRSRVLSQYSDQCDSLPTVWCIIVGVTMCLLAKLILGKVRTKNSVEREGCSVE